MLSHNTQLSDLTICFGTAEASDEPAVVTCHVEGISLWSTCTSTAMLAIAMHVKSG